MGNNHNAFQSQLVQQKVIEDVFSLCFGFPMGGTMMLGDVTIPEDIKMQYTPLDTSKGLHYYNVKMEGIKVDGQMLNLLPVQFNSGYGTVLDSGTTFTYLPTLPFKVFSESIIKATEAKGILRIPGSEPSYPDICWSVESVDFENIHTMFPTAELVFDGGAALVLTPIRYLFKMRSNAYCLGVFDNGNSGSLIGGVSTRNMVVQYDRRKGRIGFGEATCENFWHHHSRHHVNNSLTNAHSVNTSGAHH
jgi:hypothetical protein